jgi:tRNA A-37 threonylcarbamoyl transferase component Bud32
VLLFSAKDTRKRSIFIKFVRQYSVKARTGCAPILYGFNGFTDLQGGWIMVIMEELNESPARIKPEERESFKKLVEGAVQLLHAGGYVHGDIRAPDILVCPSDPSRDVKFIDFDEAGVKEEAVYPCNLNTVEVKRPNGAFDGQKILKEHDL